MDFITSRPSLHTLKVELSHLRVAVPLDRMQNLQKITFVKRYGYRSSKPVRVQTYNNLAKLLASRPADQITKLSVVLTSLHEIFQFLTPEVEPLRLKKLQMTQSFIKLDQFAIPHLRHLTSLHLSSMKNPSNSRTENSDTSEDTSPESSGDLENSEHRIGSKMSDFWSALRHAGIHLREVIVDSINAGLFGYLSHYTGLTKLVVSTNIFNTSSESDALARLFFAEPLASHIETLEELAVYARFEDLWRFGDHNILAFSRCMGLKKLGVSVARADLPNVRGSSGDPEVNPSQSQPDVIVSSRVHSFPPTLIRYHSRKNCSTWRPPICLGCLSSRYHLQVRNAFEEQEDKGQGLSYTERPSRSSRLTAFWHTQFHLLPPLSNSRVC